MLNMPMMIEVSMMMNVSIC